MGITNNENEIYENLYHYCRWGDAKKVAELLKQTKLTTTIDLSYKSYTFFVFAVKQEAPTLLNTLIEYYKETQIPEGSDDPTKKLLAYEQLSNILQYVCDSTSSISEEVEKTINEYLFKDNLGNVKELEDAEANNENGKSIYTDLEDSITVAKTYAKLEHYCDMNKAEMLKNALEDSVTTIDLFYKDNILLKKAMKSAETLSFLIDYYKQTQQRGDSDSDEYVRAHEKLSHVLQEAEKESASSIPKEVHEVISVYSSEKSTSSRSSVSSGSMDLLDEDVELDKYEDQIICGKVKFTLTADSLQELEDYHNKGSDGELNLVGHHNNHIEDVH